MEVSGGTVKSAGSLEGATLKVTGEVAGGSLEVAGAVTVGSLTTAGDVTGKAAKFTGGISAGGQVNGEVRGSEERRTAGAKRQQKHCTAFLHN
jgi:hypothetical protein